MLCASTKWARFTVKVVIVYCEKEYLPIYKVESSFGSSVWVGLLFHWCTCCYLLWEDLDIGFCFYSLGLQKLLWPFTVQLHICIWLLLKLVVLLMGTRFIVAKRDVLCSPDLRSWDPEVQSWLAYACLFLGRNATRGQNGKSRQLSGQKAI